MTMAIVIKAERLQIAICRLTSDLWSKSKNWKINSKLNSSRTQHWRPFVSFLSFHLFYPQVYPLQNLDRHLGDRYHLLHLKGGKSGPHLQFLRVTSIALHFSMSAQYNLTDLQHILKCPMLQHESHLVQQKVGRIQSCRLNKKTKTIRTGSWQFKWENICIRKQKVKC